MDLKDDIARATLSFALRRARGNNSVFFPPMRNVLVNVEAQCSKLIAGEWRRARGEKILKDVTRPNFPTEGAFLL